MSNQNRLQKEKKFYTCTNKEGTPSIYEVRLREKLFIVFLDTYASSPLTISSLSLSQYIVRPSR